MPLRWEDVAQDGRLMLTALAPAIDWTVWSVLFHDHAGAREAERRGIVPVLTRITAEGSDESIKVTAPVSARGTYVMAHSTDETDAVDRLYMNAWVEVRGQRGRVYPPEATQGPQVPAGRIFVENTFTKLFAPGGERRVTEFDIPGLPRVPPQEYRPPGWMTAMRPPSRASVLDERYVPDETLTWFGLEHTDSNQHVNSLVYPRLFAEAALRRIAAMQRPCDLLVRALDIAYRKPSFAGDSARVHLRMFELDGRVGAAGFLVSDSDGLDRPRVCARMLLG
jgi:hypothetical protein